MEDLEAREIQGSINELPIIIWVPIVIRVFTLDLSEFNVNVMTGNNRAHQRSPYDPGIQK